MSLPKNILSLFNRYKEIILYLIVGASATAINGVMYWVCIKFWSMKNIPSTVIAWVIAVFFAFWANKILVFGSKSTKFSLVMREMAGFFGCRLGTGVLDIAFMYISVDLWGWHGLLMKLVSDFIVTIVNFIASKFFIFKKKG